MSIEQHDTNPVITLDNYEEYFLMYVDGELSQNEEAMVEAFLKFHPELQAELDLLMGTKLEPEHLSYGSLEPLMASNISEHHIDEALLLHVDNELDEAGKKAVEEKLSQNEAYQQQHQWFLRTKSNPAEVVPCPNKEDLYRHTVHRMRFGGAWRIAAAVLLVVSLGVLFLQQADNTASVAGTQSQQAEVKPKEIPQDNNVAQAAETQNKEAVATKDVAVAENGVAHTNRADKKASEAPIVKAARNVLVQKEQTITETADIAVVEAPPMPRFDEPGAIQTQTAQRDKPDTRLREGIDMSLDVTEPELVAQTREKGNFKSLLRKATRIVERRTGLGATDDDEQLLIGVVAVKLK